MLWLAMVLFVSMAVAVLRGGRLTNFADIRLRGWVRQFRSSGNPASDQRAIATFFERAEAFGLEDRTLLYHPDDAGKHGVLAHVLGPNREHPVFVQGAAGCVLSRLRARGVYDDRPGSERLRVTCRPESGPR